MQESTHLPLTQSSPTLHCDWSKHWLFAVVHTPPPDVEPAMQSDPLAQSESLLHEFGTSGWQVPSFPQA